MGGTVVHARSDAEAATLEDAEAMLAAAEADDKVKGRLGPTYLTTVHKAIGHVRALESDGHEETHAQLAESAHVREIAHALLQTMCDIRDSAKLEDLPETARHLLGQGHAWHENRPSELQRAAADLVTALTKNPKLASEAHIDKQHRHDLVAGAAALLEAHHAHHVLRADRKSHTHAREQAFETLRAMAHHVRLAARLVHRGDEEALARFESPIAVHRVVPRAKAKAPATTS